MNNLYPFQVERLPYRYVALVPCCDADTLYLHHDQYYAQRIYELNHLVVQHRLQDMSLQDILMQEINLPPVWLKRLKNAAGAVYNHELFFDSIHGIQEDAKEPPQNELVADLLDTYGSLSRFEQLLYEASESLSGVGWVWLVLEKISGLHIVLTENNETVALDSLLPMFNIDLWEHAFFLDYQFDKQKYIHHLLSLIDWDKAAARYARARA